nr:MAG TPA: hypothetical protein [Caudoviricetes sp.]
MQFPWRWEVKPPTPKGGESWQKKFSESPTRRPARKRRSGRRSTA